MRIPIDTPSDKIKHIAEKSRARPIPLRVKPANHMLLERKVFTMTMPNKVKAEFEVFKAKGVLRRQSRYVSALGFDHAIFHKGFKSMNQNEFVLALQRQSKWKIKLPNGTIY